MSQQTSDKVNWVRKHVTPNGIELAISERTGIVKVNVPGMNTRAFMGYADEFLALAAAFVELQRYLEQNVDIAVSRDVRKEHRKAEQVKTRAASTAATGLMSLGFTKDQIAQILANKAG